MEITSGEKIARNIEAKKRGFHLNALASPWEKWAKDFR